MNSILYTMTAFCGGTALGMIFFGGLWFTVRKIAQNGMSAVWLMLSFMVRTGITLSGLYFIAGTSWRLMMISLLGFVIARHIVTRLTKLKTWQVNPSSKRSK